MRRSGTQAAELSADSRRIEQSETVGADANNQKAALQEDSSDESWENFWDIYSDKIVIAMVVISTIFAAIIIIIQGR